MSKLLLISSLFLALGGNAYAGFGAQNCKGSNLQVLLNSSETQITLISGQYRKAFKVMSVTTRTGDIDFRYSTGNQLGSMTLVIDDQYGDFLQFSGRSVALHCKGR